MFQVYYQVSSFEKYIGHLWFLAMEPSLKVVALSFVVLMSPLDPSLEPYVCSG